MDNFVLLVVPELSSIPAPVCLQHRDQKIRKLFQKIGTIIRSIHDSKWQSRSRETVNQHTKCFSDKIYKEDPTQGIPDWLQPFSVNLEDLEYMCSHFPLKEWTQIRKGTLQKWWYQNGSTVFILTSVNTVRDLFHEQKRLVTWKR